MHRDRIEIDRTSVERRRPRTRTKDAYGSAAILRTPCCASKVGDPEVFHSISLNIFGKNCIFFPKHEAGT